MILFEKNFVIPGFEETADFSVHLLNDHLFSESAHILAAALGEWLPMEVSQFSEDLKQGKLKIEESIEELKDQMKDLNSKRKEIFLSELGDKDKEICKSLRVGDGH